MTNEFSAVFEKDEGWYIAYCPEIPGANGQGLSIEEARSSLAQAIALILDDRRQDVRNSIPKEAIWDKVIVN